MAHYIFNFTRKNATKDRPLREQASELLHIGLWGIGDRTPNRDLLRDGDRILVFVGAPEREFIGHAILSSGAHQWSTAEAARYPGTWKGGVAFGEVSVWQHPLALDVVWSRTAAAITNPKAMFMAGIQAIKAEDFELIVASRPGDGRAAKQSPVPRRATRQSLRPTPQPARKAAPIRPPTATSALLDRLYVEAERLQSVIAGAAGQVTSEAATRALLIDKQLEALGYDHLGDIQFDAPVDSGDFADYVLHSGGRRVAVVEAKRLGAQLGAREAAQVVKYASVLGVRWGIVTDGRKIRLYDPRVPDVRPEDRLVFEFDLADYADREDFEVRLFPKLEPLTKERISDEAGLERIAVLGAVLDLLTSSHSDTLGTLRTELQRKKLVQMSREQLAEMLGDRLG